jgi:hypothetical protein
MKTVAGYAGKAKTVFALLALKARREPNKKLSEM